MSCHPNYYHPTSSSSAIHPSATNKVYLETSFASLQSPCGGGGGGEVPCNGATTSQLSSLLQYDVSSLSGEGCPYGFHSDSTTVAMADDSTTAHQNSKGKNVAFDIAAIATTNQRVATSSRASKPLQPNVRTSPTNPRGILLLTPSSSLPINRPVSSEFSRRFVEHHQQHQVHDDWYGMAPLASPETLSEISSISSRRASLLNTFASSIEMYLQQVTFGGNDEDYGFEATTDNASQMLTPKVMRRTPKIGGNLSQCADDWRAVDSYNRMEKMFVTTPSPALLQSSASRVPSASSSGASFESADSYFLPSNSTKSVKTSVPTTTTTTSRYSYKPPQNYSKSDDNLDSATDEIDGDIVAASKLTLSDQHFHQPQLPLHQCPVMASSSDTFHSAESSLTHLSQVPSHREMPAGVLESHFPVFARAGGGGEQSSLPSAVDRGQSPIGMSRPLSAASSSASTTASTVTYTPIPKFRLGTRKRTDLDDADQGESRPLLSDRTVDVNPVGSPLEVRRRGRRNNRKVVYPVLATFSPVRGRVGSASPTPPYIISSSSSSSMASNRGGSTGGSGGESRV